MANVLANMQYVQQQGELGRQQGQQNRFSQLAGQAYSAAPDQQNALIGQAVGVDPQAGLQLGSQLGAINSSRQATAQAAEVDHMKKLGGAARYMQQALQSKNPAQVEGAWQAVRPYLAEISGKEPPQQWDPAMEPALYQAIAATGGTPEQKGVVLSAGGQLRNPMTGKLLADNPQSLQYHDVPMGEGKAAGVFDPSTGTVRPAVGSAVPASDPMQPLLDQANAAIQMGAPEDQVRAWLQQQAQQMGMQPQEPGQGGNQLQTTQAVAPGQFGVGTPRPSAANSTFAQLSPEEVEQLGLPKGTVAQRGSNGKIDIISKPGDGAAKPMSEYQRQQLKVKANGARKAVRGSLDDLSRMANMAEKVLAMPGLDRITGVMGAFPNIPGSEAFGCSGSTGVP